MTGDVVTVTAIIGALIGVVSLLLKILVVAKNETIKAQQAQIEDVTRERDLFRELILSARRERD